MTTPYDEYIRVMSKWLSVKDEEAISLCVSVIMSIFLPGDPIWAYVVSPPGAGKTEIVRSFVGKRIYTTDSLTPNSLISGLNTKQAMANDMLPKLDGKVLIIKDYTTLLTKPETVRDEIMGQLRSAYDGSLERNFGSGVGRKSYQSKFGILAAVTDVIDRYYKTNSILGERFLKIRLRYDRDDIMRKAAKCRGNEDQIRSEIEQAATNMLVSYESRSASFVPDIPDTDIDGILELSTVVSILRSAVPRDFKSSVSDTSETEVGTRLCKQIIGIGQGLQLIDKYEYSRLVRLSWDSIPNLKKQLLRNILNKGVISTQDLLVLTSVSETHVLNELHEMEIHKVLEKTKLGGELFWSVRSDFEQTMKNGGMI